MRSFLRCRWLSVAVAAVTLVCNPANLSANDKERIFEIAKEVKDKVDEYVDAVEQFDKLEKMLIDALAGKKPPPQSDYWQSLVIQFQKRTEELQKIDIPSNFNPDGYSVSPEDLVKCERRNWALAQLSKYLQELESLEARGQATRSEMKKFADASSQVHDDFKSLLKLHQKAMASGQTLMTWNWWDLDQHVVPATAALERITLTKLGEIDNAVTKVSKRVENLRGNLNTINNSECMLHQNWAGQLIIEGTKIPISLSVKKTDGKFVLYYSARGRTARVCPTKVDFLSRQIEYRPACSGPSTLVTRLAISTDYTSMSGAMVDTMDAGVRHPIILGMQ